MSVTLVDSYRMGQVDIVLVSGVMLDAQASRTSACCAAFKGSYIAVCRDTSQHQRFGQAQVDGLNGNLPIAERKEDLLRANHG